MRISGRNEAGGNEFGFCCPLSISGREVGKFAGCQVCPEVFDGIEFRGISRETIRGRPALVSFKEIGCFPAAMGGKPIPNEQYPATNVASDVEKETLDGFGVDIAGNDGEEEAAVVDVTAGGDGAYRHHCRLDSQRHQEEDEEKDIF